MPPVRCQQKPEGPRGAYNRLVCLLTDARQFRCPLIVMLAPLVALADQKPRIP